MAPQPLRLEQPSQQQLLDIVYGEFNVTPEDVSRDVNTLKEWLKKQPHLPNVDDDEWLTHCLLRCKNSLEKTKSALDAYYTLKTEMPEIYDDRDMQSHALQITMKAMAFVPLPKLTADMCRVSILRVFDSSKSDIVAPDDVIKTTYMSADIRLKMDYCRADVLIFDMQNFTMPIITLTMGSLRKFLALGINGMPMRHKVLYVLNAPPGAETLVMMGKSFVRKELHHKLVILKNVDELVAALGKEILPKDYGGEERALDEIRDMWVEFLKEQNEWFISQHSMKAVNEKRLTSMPSRLGDIHTQGSFRQIAVD